MPELAEVEFYRKQWDSGISRSVLSVVLHSGKRVFRSVNTRELQAKLAGARLLGSAVSGKQMLFRFSRGLWLGIHLGMTGKLLLAPRNFKPGKHDHLVLFQKNAALVFSDMRQFGRVRFDEGPKPPAWWSRLSLPIASAQFTRKRMTEFLQAHAKLPIKAALLLQAGFPGVGNWMADEILWRARINPHFPAGNLASNQSNGLWRSIRFVCREAVRHIGHDFSDPPGNWFFHERWSKEGRCPRDQRRLIRETIGGRTTAWCPECQSGKASATDQ
jgi:formamidopyrimidine-DNA glycosylase